MSIHIQKAKEENIEEIITIYNQYFQLCKDPILYQTELEIKIPYLENQIYIIKEYNNIRGFIDAEKLDSEIRIHYMAISKGNTSKGIGREAIFQFLEKIKDDQYKKITALPINSRATEFYERLGFKENLLGLVDGEMERLLRIKNYCRSK